MRQQNHQPSTQPTISTHAPILFSASSSHRCRRCRHHSFALCCAASCSCCLFAKEPRKAVFICRDVTMYMKLLPLLLLPLPHERCLMRQQFMPPLPIPFHYIHLDVCAAVCSLKCVAYVGWFVCRKLATANGTHSNPHRPGPSHPILIPVDDQRHPTTSNETHFMHL